MKRTVAMALGLVILRWRCLETSAPQLVCSSTAIALILQPDLLSHIGFTLSVVATVLICTLAMDSGGRRAWAVYLALGFFIPILAFPLTGFFFSKISWWAPVHSIVIGWIWLLVWVPVGFAGPFVLEFLPFPLAGMMTKALQGAWLEFLLWQEHWSTWVSGGYQSVYRPTWIEFVLQELLLLSLIMALWRIFFPARMMH